MATPTLTMIPSGYKAEKVYSVLPTNGDGDFTFNRNNTATRVNKNGLIEQVATDIPRLDYSDGSCPSLLIEPTSLNLATYSQDFSQSVWQKQLSVVTGGILSPDGTTNASKLVINNGVDASATGAGLRRGFTISANTSYTYSIFAKKDELHNVQVRLEASSANLAAYYFNLNDGSLLREDVTGFTNVSHSIKDYGSNWWRISISFTSTTLTSLISYVWTFKNNDYTDDVGDGVSGVNVFGAQLEENSILTSYIPTTTQTQSRSAESFSNDFSSQPTVANTNTVVLKFIPMGFSTDFYELLRFSDGTDEIALEGFQTNNYDVYGSGLTPSGMVDGALSLDAGSINTISFSYSGTSLRFSHNGSTINTVAPTGNLPTITEVSHSVGGLSPIKILDLRVYNDFKTQEELNTLTTI